MADETLLMLARDVRGKTLRLLDGVDAQAARFVPQGLNNSILWHAAHAYVVVEYLSASAASGREPVVPEGWFEGFSWKGNPANVKQWPELSKVVEMLKEQFERLISSIERLTPDQLGAIHGDPARNKTLRWSILHGLHDEANHQGEIWLLRKIHAKQNA